MLTVYRISRRTTKVLNMQGTGVRSFLFYIYVSMQIQVPSDHKTTVSSSRLQSPFHARRPCAPTHLCRGPRTLPQSTKKRPCRRRNSLHPPLPVVAPLHFLLLTTTCMYICHPLLGDAAVWLLSYGLRICCRTDNLTGINMFLIHQTW
jgi:hypothetical protein